MATREQRFEKLCRLLSDVRLCYDRRTDFGTLCRKVEGDPVEMENMLYERFGMSGEEMLDALKRGNLRVKM